MVFTQKYLLTGNNLYNMICQTDLLHNSTVCNTLCPSGSFALPGMMSCHPLLDCYAEITLLSLISISVVKTVYLANWKGYTVVLSVLSSKRYKDDFLHNLFMIKSFSPHRFVVQLLGYCDNSLLTEYYKLGNALNIQYYLMNSLKAHNNLETRLNLCISYVSIIQFLHNTHVGVRVMCDSNTLEKALSQYLLTVDLELVVNDLDATPDIDKLRGGVHCGSRELTGQFIAPEQAWPYPGKEFDINQMPVYDHKTDIFKVPDICSWFLGDHSEVDIVKYKLYNVHKSCKNIHPHERPSADVLIRMYKKVLNAMI